MPKEVNVMRNKKYFKKAIETIVCWRNRITKLSTQKGYIYNF